MIASLLLFIAARSTMSFAGRLKLKPGLGLVPHPMIHKGPMIQHPVKLPQLQMQFRGHNPGSAANRRQARSYGMGDPIEGWTANINRHQGPFNRMASRDDAGRMRDDIPEGYPTAGEMGVPTPGNIEVNTGAGKGFGGGEARRDAEATVVDPQESFDQYVADRAEPVVDDQAADELRAHRLMSSKRRAARLAKVPLGRWTVARQQDIAAAQQEIAARQQEIEARLAKIDEELQKPLVDPAEATRNPDATVVNPDDPKGKQQAIHKAESFEE